MINMNTLELCCLFALRSQQYKTICLTVIIILFLKCNHKKSDRQNQRFLTFECPNARLFSSIQQLQHNEYRYNWSSFYRIFPCQKNKIKSGPIVLIWVLLFQQKQDQGSERHHVRLIKNIKYHKITVQKWIKSNKWSNKYIFPFQISYLI